MAFDPSRTPGSFTPPRIFAVYVFSNGNTMVFDDRGQQMPDYQGAWSEVGDRIQRDCPVDVPIYHGLEWQRRWNRGV